MSLIVLFAINQPTFAGRKTSPNKNSVKLADFIAQVDEIPSMTYEELMTAFEYVRDTKFYSVGETKRRISWLYIHDGCQVRAHASAVEIAKKFGDLPFKTVYVFRSRFKFGKALKATHDLLDYKMGWMKFHVALAAKVGNQVYIIDPPYNFSKPITFEKWRDALVKEVGIKSVEYSLCNNYSYDAFYGNCKAGDQNRGANYIQNEMLGGMRYGQPFEGYLSLEKKFIENGTSTGEFPKSTEFYLESTPPWL